jgi:hypothetical protein
MIGIGSVANSLLSAWGSAIVLVLPISNTVDAYVLEFPLEAA